jgi:hypothetical protein
VIPIIIDIEASGFGSGSYPIEIGVINELGQRYCSLIKPLPQWVTWDESAFKAHGISRIHLETQGQPALAVAKELNELLHDKRVFSDGWVADQYWLNTLYQAVGLWPSFTLSPIEGIQTPSQHECWDDTLMQLRQQHPESRHRASGDAYLIQQAYIASAKK